MSATPFRRLLERPVHLLAFGFGTGLSPRAPGTAGTLVGVGLYLLIGDLTWWGYVGVTALGFAVGVWVCGVTARNLGVHDHPGIVWDEVVGFLVTMTALPRDWMWIAGGFAAFRLLDILKPWPIKLVDKQIPGGLGIMLDDLVAGIFACALLHLTAGFL